MGGAVKTWGTTSWGTWYYTGPMIGLGDGFSATSHNDRVNMRKSDLIVLFGGNPAWSAQGNNMNYYLDAKKAGAKFIFLDPLYNDSAMILADDWVPVRPGTDHALVLGMAHTLLVEDDPENDPLIDWDFLNRCTVGFDENHMPEGADPKENFKDYVLGKMMEHQKPLNGHLKYVVFFPEKSDHWHAKSPKPTSIPSDRLVCSTHEQL